MASLPPNAHVSTHPCVRAKLSQLRSQSTAAREVKSLIHEIATIVGVEALATCLQTVSIGTVCYLHLRSTVLKPQFVAPRLA
jgi:uracil phosphoribosyltransferase